MAKRLQNYLAGVRRAFNLLPPERDLRVRPPIAKDGIAHDRAMLKRDFDSALNKLKRGYGAH